ncbi:MAG: phosphoribosyltransferase [Candidatus Nezhaarchaeota archaeon]|nr:phosphoribosyltransferase [Candidatus Nezhaarchaeota archaeon]MCX8141704.1 phosphoribosyltransferase [Candidatus Nezhaarchaeota archaeon]MDW8049971.1 phosphoribosyltransferase [Nitrososphaerota archaeon]
MSKKMNVKVVSWDEVVKWCKELARRIRASGFKPDVIVAIARGGFTPARLLCDYLNVIDLLSIKIEHWIETGKHKEEATIKYPFNYDLSGKNVLIVDDIADTGKSIIVAKRYILDVCKPKELKTATMQLIPATSMIVPDYYVDEVKEWTWYMYPWNFTEDMVNLTMRIVKDKPEERWTAKAVSEKFEEWYGVKFQLELFNEILEEMVIREKLVKVDGFYAAKT